MPDLWELTPAMLAGVMAIDRRRLALRWAGLLRDQKSGRRVDERAIEGVRREVERSTERREKRRAGKPVPDFAARADLPILEHREKIAALIAEHQVVVVCGETGSGKTTQIPQICLDVGRGESGLIGHTQPRRIAARTLSARIAEELSIPQGSRAVGYKVRFGDETDRDTYIKVMTDGILLAETQNDRLLEQYDTIIIDEAHERSLNIDFLLGILRQVLPRRPDLKVIVTSATIDPDRFARHFANLGGKTGPAPVISVSGRLFPVEIRYRPINEDDLEQGVDPRDEERAIVDAVDELTVGDGGRGDVLVFLPGEREIRETAEALRKHHPAQTEILPLFARLSPQDQMKVFQKHAHRRIVLSTNVAETSLTVPGIRYVIDAGMARISRYSARTKIQRLPIEAISQASANQRAGRCGRVMDGICVRLYSEQDFASRSAFTDPEIIRTNLASVILQMKALNLGKVEEFPFVEPPDSRMIKDGYETLHELGAIDEQDQLTDVGRSLAKLPIDPRIGRMLLASDGEGCLNEMLVMAAAMSVQDPRLRPPAQQDQADMAHKRFAHEESDFLAYLRLWAAYSEQEKHLSSNKLRQWCHDHFISWLRMREWDDVHRQLSQLAHELGMRSNSKPATYDQIHRALLTGLLSNIGTKTDTFEFQGARGNKFQVWPGSVLFKKGPKWIAAAEIVETTRRYARICCKVQPEWAEELGKHVLKRSHSDPHWSKEGGQVSAFERVTLFGLVLAPRRRVSYGPIDPADARDIFIQHALVEQEWPWQAAFMLHNQRIIARVHELEAKVRKHDILAEKTAIYDFYDKRVPTGVFSIGTFEKFRREVEQKEPKRLFMQLSDVMRRDVPEVTSEKFPDSITAFGAKLNIKYTLEPGADNDGLSMDVPIENLNQVDPDRAEWLVPGMLREKVTALIKSLPKQYRVQLDAAVMAETLATALPFGQGSLLEQMSKAISNLTGVQVPVNAWVPQGLPEYLRMHLRVLDEKGGVLAQGRNAAELKAKLADRSRRHMAMLARKNFGREGLTEWDFGDVPETFELERSGAKVIGYPALVDHGDTVALTLVESRARADAATWAGVRRLFALAAQHEIDQHVYAQKNRQRLALLHGPLGKPEVLFADLRCLVAERAFMAGPAANIAAAAIRTKEQFDARQAERWGKIGLCARETCELVERILSMRQQAALRLDKPVSDEWRDNAKDAKDQLTELTAPGFLVRVGDERLRHYPRYLEALVLRLRKLDNGSSGRDTRSLNVLEPLVRRYRAVASRLDAPEYSKLDPKALDEHRWLLEELRVSLFAERLGTAEPVSAKRINDHWAGLGLGEPNE